MDRKSPLSPIILIGSHRSGTTMLGQCMAKHPDICYWLEPNHVWTWGRYAKMDNDVLTERDADEETCSAIGQMFNKHYRQGGRKVICEKTPANALRIPYVQSIFPTARFVHILRDPRGVILSNFEKMSKGGYGWRAVLRRMGRTPIWEWPQHFDKMRSEILLKVFGKRLPIFGPKPPGWQDWLSKSPIELTAFQWREVTGAALRDGRALEAGSYMEFHYDEFVQWPEKYLRKICEFCDLESEKAPELMALGIRPERAERWRSILSTEDLAKVRPIVEPTMKAAGFKW